VIDPTCSSTASDLKVQENDEGIVKTPYRRSMEKFSLGPKAFRRTTYKNLNASSDGILYGFRPVDEAIGILRSHFGKYAVFFYNELCPDVIAMLWRPTTFHRQPFSAMHAEFSTPVEYKWEENSLVTKNSNDVLRAIRCILRHIIIDYKIFDDKSIKDEVMSKASQKTKRKLSSDDSSDNDGASD
jgi:hypothetical protein